MQESYKTFVITIEQDTNTESPREWDNIGTMVCFHKGYNLGDTHNYKSENYASWKELKAALVKDGAILIIPLFLYDHSGISMRIGSFQGLLPQGHADFDSGQVGYIYTTKKDILTNLPASFGKKRLTKRMRQQAQEWLESEVKTYDQYISGDVYSYTIKSRPEIEYEGDSCGGFYGYAECLQTAKEVIDSAYEHIPKARNKSISARMQAI